MKSISLAEGLELLVAEASFFDVDTTLLITRGLLRHGQQECVLALREPTATLLEFAKKYLRTVDKLAADGRLVHAGGLSVLPPGVAPVDGFAFAPVHAIDAQLVDAEIAPESALFAVPLRGLEVAMAQRAGVARVLARMGAATRFFPFPPWFDADRGSVIDAADLAGTLLGQQVPPPSALSDVCIERVGERIVLSLPAETAAFAGEAAANGVLPLASTTMGVGSAAALVFRPGAPPASITAAVPSDRTGSALPGTSASFLILLRGKSEAMHVEDGFVVMLPEPDWDRLRAALKAGADFDIDTVGGLGFRVQVSSRMGAAASFTMKAVQLLTAEEAWGQVTTASALRGWVDALCQELDAFLLPLPRTRGELGICCTLAANSTPHIEMIWTAGMAPTWLVSAQQALTAVAAPTVATGSHSLQLVLDLHPQETA